ncbi:MAG: DUF1697 domain-containing protein [Acidimicrobiales bacterium]|nr:DUF1697 domain-containing protein [Acidimicrobiales bacterium]
MSSKGHVALIRGINVGGKNPVPMVELRAAFEACGFGNVSTYIQSGNVLFDADAKPSELEPQIESAMEDRFGVPLVVVVRTRRQLADVVDKAPPGFGTQPDTYHSDAVFLRSPLTPAKAMKVVALRDEVDAAWPGKGVIYFQRLSARRTQSRMNKIVGTPEYQNMTIRSWNTTTKLRTLLDDR